MRTLAKVISVIVAISALTVMAPGHAEEVQVLQVAQLSPGMVDTIKYQTQERFDNIVQVLIDPILDINYNSKDVDCLAHNIYYEAGSEPLEGKVAVAMVTINRVRDGRFGKSICSVVDQRTVVSRARQVTVTKMVRNVIGQEVPQKATETVVQNVTVCQFSWRCMFVRTPHKVDERWQSSQAVAERLLAGEYVEWQNKYSEALYFHAIRVHPGWHKPQVAQVGGHVFFRESFGRL